MPSRSERPSMTETVPHWQMQFQKIVDWVEVAGRGAGLIALKATEILTGKIFGLLGEGDGFELDL